ncbi:FAD-dependent oxidoreductase [Caldovatus aquaticus]|uniref:FAD-dependent oxidoreductase n=1 Tax=Caldovatus aquaticus TaxID=2865671 RepID=A0ABS7F1R2_9PROT|nr:FAD-dependent oxidoreductase [Caldovatus aquaticus]MBW8269570.1 FAD-dependent oxidoreductase [Caldovatus aquaticus]
MADPDYQALVFPYVRSPDQDAPAPVRHPAVVVGAGPVGLAAAVDLARHGVPVLLLDEDERLSAGSRAICFAKRTLEIFDRLGCGDRMVAKGVGWKTGKVFFRDAPVYAFDLLPETGHERPAFINLQQYYVEGYLLDRARELANLEIRWRNRVIGIAPDADGVTLTVTTAEGDYRLRADWVIAADGARSTLRALLGLESRGRVFRDRFLIADVRMSAPFPAERWFWFDPPFHPGQSVLLHRQPDDVWRVDFQLGWDADPVEERKPERVIPRIRALLGEGVDFALLWVSVYTFACLRIERFRHGRVLFAGDAAHGVSPFGARGANSGIQDAENLAWKLALVLRGKAPEHLLDSYDAERVPAADENILNSTRSTDFITPKSEVSRTFRDAVLRLARDCPFARRLVNSGRLSVPATLRDSPLNTPDEEPFAGAMVPGAPATDAPVRAGGRPSWFLRHVGDTFSLVHFLGAAEAPPAALRGLAAEAAVPLRALAVALPGADPPAPGDPAVIEDAEGLLAARFDACPGTTYLLRPDQHVCARWRRLDPPRVRAALARATGHA